MIPLGMLSRLAKKRDNRVTFGRNGLEERLHVPPRKNETVPGRDRVGVENPHGIFVLTKNSARGKRTEGARLGRPHIFKGPGSPVMDLVPVARLENPKSTRFLHELLLLVNLDGHETRSLAKRFVDASVGLALVTHGESRDHSAGADSAAAADVALRSSIIIGGNSCIDY